MFALTPLALASAIAASASPAAELLPQLLAQAPGLEPTTLALALRAAQCAQQRGDVPALQRLALIDYSRPSTEPRMWVFDLEQRRLLYREHVAHGRGSGENLAQRFSNREGSYQSSLGLFRTGDTYAGGNGYSLRLDGLEPRINDRARDRLLVIHGAPYVNPDNVRSLGRLGRSLGCPALRPQIARPLIDSIKQGHLLFSYFPEPGWLASSSYLHCQPQVAELTPTRG